MTMVPIACEGLKSISPLILPHQDDKSQETGSETLLGMSSLDSFWFIPPIQDAIALHLTRIDYWNCVQVSKSFNAVFIPFLWSDAGNLPSNKQSIFLNSNAPIECYQHIKQLHIDTRHSQAWDDFFLTHGLISKLVSLSVMDMSRYRTPGSHMIDFFAIAGTHPGLTKLSISSFEVDRAFISDFVKFMSNNTLALQDLSLTLEGYDTHLDLVDLLEACGRVENVVFKARYELEVFNTYPSKNPFTAARVKDLEIWCTSYASEGMQILYVEQCPHLRRLFLDSPLKAKGSGEKLARVLETHTPDLEELVLYNSQMDAEVAATVIRGCSTTLRKLDVWLQTDFRPIRQAIVLWHGPTLGHLDLFRGYTMSVEDVFVLAGFCTSLVTLEVKVEWSSANSHQDTLGTLKATPWKCSRLQRLGLSICISVKSKRGFKAEADVLFQQVGRMGALESLSLYTNPFLMQITQALLHGMENLSGLKRLKQFQYVDGNEPSLSLEDLIGMVNLWPRLQSFGGLTGEYAGMSVSEVVEFLQAEAEQGRVSCAVTEG